jgi:hypothetical protein
MGRLSHSCFQRSGVQLTGPRFFVSNTRLAVVKLGASNAPSHNAKLTMIVIGQKISLFVVVKKKIVLATR